jgi:hypothetical protein
MEREWRNRHQNDFLLHWKSFESAAKITEVFTFLSLEVNKETRMTRIFTF